MKLPLPLLSWLALPLAAAVGYVGSRHHHAAPPVPAEGVISPSGNASPEATSVTLPGFILTWTDRLAKCTAADLPGLHAEIQQLPGKADVHRAMLLLCARWVELDAAGGLAFFSALEDKPQRTAGRLMLLTEWAAHDPLEVYTVITQQPEKEAEADITNVGHALLRADPDKFWIWFKNARKPLPWSWGGNDAWQQLAANHFDELSEIAAELMDAESNAGTGDTVPPGSKLEGLYAMLAGAMAEKDPDKAVEWAGQLPESVRNKALTRALEVIAAKSPEKITDHLHLLKPKQVGGNTYSGGGSDTFLKRAIETMLDRDPLAAVAWLAQVNANLPAGEYPHQTFKAISERFARAMRDGKISPEQAFAAARAAKEGNERVRTHLLSAMWEGLPAEQLATTANWLTTIDSKDAAQQALQGIFPEWVKQDQSAALAFATTLTDRDLTAKLFEKVAQNSSAGLVSTQGERMANALKLIPPDYRAEIMANQIGWRFGESRMDHSGPFDGAATSAALEGLPPGPATNKAFSQVAAAWGATEPEAALTWATGQLDSALRKSATGAAMEAWAKEDAWGTSQWIVSLPSGETRDTASHHLARSLRKDEPASAWTWAGSIGDPATRLEAQAAVLQEWRNVSGQDAAAAVQALAGKLPPAEHQKLVEAITAPVKTK